MSPTTTTNNAVSQVTTNWVILSYSLQTKKITHITNNTPEGGVRMMEPSGNIEKAREAYCLLQYGGMSQLFQASRLADAWYAKKGNLVLVFGTDIRGDHTVGKKASKRIARALAPATWANLPIPTIKFVSMTKGNDGHGWISAEYLKRNNIKTPQGRKHFSFIFQDGNIQYKGACVVRSMPEGIDLILPNDPKVGVEYEGQFFNLTMGYSHSEPRIDVQTFCNTCRWMDYSDVINANAQAVASRIVHSNVDGRGGLAPYVKAGVIPALVEEYRRQEIAHLTGEVSGGFRIPAVTGLISFNKNVGLGHVRINRKQGLIVCNPIDYSMFQPLLGGMDGDDHVIAMFVEKGKETCVYLYRQPNQLGEGVFLKLEHYYNDISIAIREHTQLPLVKVVAEQPKPKVVNMINYFDAVPLNELDAFKSVIVQQLKSSSYIGRAANLSMLLAIAGMIDGEFPDFESMIGLELKNGTTEKLDEWCQNTQSVVSNYLGGCTILPANIQAKTPVQGPTPNLGVIVHRNLGALENAIKTVETAVQTRIGYDSIFAGAKLADPQLSPITWVTYYGKLVRENRVHEFDAYIEAHIAKVGAAQFEREVYVALARTWFTNTIGYALLHKGVYEVVCNILNCRALTEDAMVVATMFGLVKDIDKTIYVFNAGMYTGKGEFIGVCKISDGAYQTVDRDGQWKFTVHQTKSVRWQLLQYVGKLTTYRKRIIVRAGMGLPDALKSE